MKFVIEHIEPELYQWCLIEYWHISRIVGKENIIFTNIGKKAAKKLKKYGKVYSNSITDLKLTNICVLSQYAEKALATKDKNNFEYFVFGGILGDNPAKKRTNILIKNLKKHKIKFETRNLGKKQMPTDIVVYVAKEILDGKKLNDLKFVDELEIEINENESVVLPFRYAVDGNKVVIDEKLVEYLRKRKEF
ncbi:hypothetical protein J4204_01910 [Candidatus Woesearchaeota archaeon]|nr:hypothetical protein [Candidatus Woesearchaeota archaeon]